MSYNSLCSSQATKLYPGASVYGYFLSDVTQMHQEISRFLVLSHRRQLHSNACEDCEKLSTFRLSKGLLRGRHAKAVRCSVTVSSEGREARLMKFGRSIVMLIAARKPERYIGIIRVLFACGPFVGVLA